MGNKLILLADDDRDDTEMFSEALGIVDAGIDCRCFGNGSLLLEHLENTGEKPQLIFLDLNMPVMNGWQCLSLLKEDSRYREIPVIIISTSSHQAEIQNAMGHGALCYFVKPNDFDDLIYALNAIANGIESGLESALRQLQAAKPKHIFGL